MSFDALSLKILTLEIKNQIIGRTIDKIMQHRDGEFAFILRNETGPSIMLISINPNFTAFFHSQTHKINFMNGASNYQLFLKKHIEGARLTDIKTINSDRILALFFNAKNNFSETEYILFFEFMGRHSNSFLYNGKYERGGLDPGKITGALNFSNNLCEFINNPQKNDISLIIKESVYEDYTDDKNNEDIIKFHAASQTSNDFMFNEFINKYNGLSPFLCRASAQSGSQTALYEIASIHKANNYSNLIDLLKSRTAGKKSLLGLYKPAIYSSVGAKGKIKTFAYPFYINSTEDKNGDKHNTIIKKEFQTLNECYAEFYITRDSELITARLKDKIIKLNEIAEKKKETFISDLKISEEYEKYSNYGHLIISAINDLKKRDENIKAESTVINNITIPLDSRILISENAGKYFKIYKKLKAKHEYCINYIHKLDGILARINECSVKFDNDTVLFSENLCHEIEKNIVSIADELIYEVRLRKKFISEFNKELKNFNSCVVRKKHGGRSESNDVSGRTADGVNKHYRLFEGEEGFLIYVGKNDAGNDYILSKIACPQDYWLHVKDFRGSSVILKVPKNTEDKSIEKAVEEAALYAAYYSQGRNAVKIFVSCAMRKYVKKIKRAPGKVTYTNETAILVDINKLENKFKNTAQLAY